MKDFSKYQGIFPAFYACYDDAGAVSPSRVRAFTEYLIDKGVTGLYVGGSSGECIYQSVAERKLLLENVMAAAKGKITVIAHVACNNTADSAEHAALVKIDEEGVTGAAFTDLAVCGAGLPQEEADFTLDRPFYFAVTSSDGSILFSGIVQTIE